MLSLSKTVVALAVAALVATMPVSADANQLRPGTYEFNLKRSNARISVSGTLGTVRAALPVSRGTLEVSGDGRIRDADAVLNTRALRTRNRTAERQLKGRDGFDTANHPRVRFDATGIDHDGDLLTVTGNLTVKQVTRPITLSGRIVRSNRRRVVAELEGTIDRMAFGVTAGRPFYGPTATVKMRMVASLPRGR